MSKKYQVLFLALLAITLLAAPTAMRAGTNLGMQMSSNPDTFQMCDNNVNFSGCTANPPGGDMNPALGQITYIGGVGGWATNITSGLGPPFEYLVPLLDISTFNATAGAGAGALTVLLSVTGLSSAGGFPAGVTAALNSIGGTATAAGTTITTQAWYSASNTAFCASAMCGSTPLTSLLTVTGRSYSGAVGGSGLLSSGPYSITLALTIDSHGAADTVSLDDEFDLPEPATLSLLGSGLLGLGLALRKKLLI